MYVVGRGGLFPVALSQAFCLRCPALEWCGNCRRSAVLSLLHAQAPTLPELERHGHYGQAHHLVHPPRTVDDNPHLKCRHQRQVDSRHWRKCRPWLRSRRSPCETQTQATSSHHPRRGEGQASQTRCGGLLICAIAASDLRSWPQMSNSSL